MTSKNLKSYGLDLSEVSLISGKDFNSINVRSKVNIGDILFGMIGTIGNPVLIDHDDFAIKNVALIKEKSNVLNLFLIQLLKSSVFDRYIANENAGGTQKFLSLSKIRDFEFLCPDKEEQTKIGNFFKQLNEIIALQQRKLELLKKLKQGYLQQMFPDKDMTTPRLRFSEFNGDWKQCEFTDLSKEIYGGGTPKTTNRSFWSGTLPWIQSSDIDLNDFYSINSSKYVSKEGLKNSSAKRIPENSITIVTRVGVGKLAYVPFEFSTSQDFISLSKLSVNPRFAIYLLYKLLVNLSRNSQGTSIKGITRNELFSKKFLIPTSKYEQAKIGECFKMIDSLITLQRSKIKKLKILKQSYLQKLFP